MQLAMHFRQSLLRFAVRLTEFLDLRPTDPTYNVSQGSWEGVWVGLVSVLPREPRIKALGWELCASRAVADNKGDKGSACHDFKWTLGHHSSTPTQPSTPSEEHG
ncbi:hypothetical protein VTK56DRAFT_2367 [Thermocarpiscus australiensis]